MNYETNIAFKKVKAFSYSPRSNEIVDCLQNGDDFFILLNLRGSDWSSSSIVKFNILNDVSEIWNVPCGIDAKIFSSGILFMENQTLVFTGLFHNVKKNEKINISSADKAQVRTFINTANGEILRQEIDSCLDVIPYATRNKVDDKYFETVLRDKVIYISIPLSNGMKFLLLKIKIDEILELPPFIVKNTSTNDKIVLAIFDTETNSAIVINKLEGSNLNVSIKETDVFDYQKYDTNDTVSLSYNLFNLNDIETSKIKLEIFADSTLNESASIVRDVENINTKFNFKLLQKTKSGVYFFRLKYKDGESLLYSNVVPLYIVNNDYSKYVDNKWAFWTNNILLIGLVLISIYIMLIINVPSLKNYKYNIFSSLLNNGNAAPLIFKILWWLAFTVIFIGFIYKQVLYYSIELFKLMKS